MRATWVWPLECDRLLCRLLEQSNAQEECSHCNLSLALNNFNEHFMINARMCDAALHFFFFLRFCKTPRRNSEAARTTVIIVVNVVAVCLGADVVARILNAHTVNE